MNNDHYGGILIILAIVAIVMYGGSSNNSFRSARPDQRSIEQKIADTKKEVGELEKKIQSEKNKSEYSGLVTISRVNRSNTPEQEYVTLRTERGIKPILITGWSIKSLSSGNGTTIPKGNYLYFTKTNNSEEDIYLSSDENIYIITGRSPIGLSFKANKCFGFIGDYQTFTPSIKNNCPLPRDEDLSSIPNRIENDKCFDYIDSMSRCRIQSEPLPITWSYECKNFIIEKINYSSCVDAHKTDSDFYEKEWWVYLKRSDKLWKNQRETIVLYDQLGKVVDTYEY